jgi:hypothetical protein
VNFARAFAGRSRSKSATTAGSALPNSPYQAVWKDYSLEIDHPHLLCREPDATTSRYFMRNNPQLAVYGWVKAFHIIAVMAGMLYLPRLFVYHCAAEKGWVQSETFKVMERRLLRAIINPAMIATWVLGGMWISPPCLKGRLGSEDRSG